MITSSTSGGKDVIPVLWLFLRIYNISVGTTTAVTASCPRQLHHAHYNCTILYDVTRYVAVKRDFTLLKQWKPPKYKLQLILFMLCLPSLKCVAWVYVVHVSGVISFFAGNFEWNLMMKPFFFLGSNYFLSQKVIASILRRKRHIPPRPQTPSSSSLTHRSQNINQTLHTTGDRTPYLACRLHLCEYI